VTPDQAVRDWLRKMGEVSTATPADLVNDVAQFAPFPPVVASMELLKRREAPGRQVHALAYEDAAGSSWFWIVRLIEDDSGSWRVCGGGGGDAQGEPERPYPWISYAGCWDKDGLALGGWVTGGGAERVAAARLSIRETVLVDDVGGGVGLFVTSTPTAGSRATIELLAGDDSVLWRDELELDE
jgi:hypothetical protein